MANFSRNISRIHLATFILPALLLYGTFAIYPILSTVWMSFFNETAYVGWENYEELFGNSYWFEAFRNSLSNNLIFFAIHMLFQIPIATILAALLSLPDLKGSHFYRTVIFLPTLLSFVVVGFIWQLILSPLWGVSGSILTGLGLEAYIQPWLGQKSTALITISLVSVWQFIGIPALLLYASLVNINQDILDAAKVDGIGGIRVFLRVKLPLILPTILLVSILTYVGNFNAFDLVYTIKGALAGPDFSSDLLGTLFYRTFFGFQLQEANPHMGATIASLMLGVILIGVMIYLYLTQRKLIETAN